jgi:hypothetical protein
MNDPLSAPRKPQGQRPPVRRPQRPPLSKESRFVGYLVLGFGVLAVVTVLLLAFGQKGPDVASAPQPEAENVATLTQDIQPVPQQTATPQSVPAVSPPPVIVDTPKPELYYARQPDVDMRAMEGAWQSMIGEYTGVLQIQNGTYQIILATQRPNAPRLYSLGTYSTIEDIVTLTPRLDWPAPASQLGASYEVLTRAPFSLLVGMYKGRLLWQNVPHSEDRVLTVSRSPLFLDNSVNYIVWQKINR